MFVNIVFMRVLVTAVYIVLMVMMIVLGNVVNRVIRLLELMKRKIYDYLYHREIDTGNAVTDCRNRIQLYRYDTVDLINLVVLQTRDETVKIISRDITRILSDFREGG